MKYVCSRLNIADEKCLIDTTPSIPASQTIRMTGQMLVDSKELAFLYALDCDEHYHYIVFYCETWPVLKEINEKQMPLYLSVNEREMELTHFHSEFTYLLTNIQDNPNYGEQMNEEVERVFFK